MRIIAVDTRVGKRRRDDATWSISGPLDGPTIFGNAIGCARWPRFLGGLVRCGGPILLPTQCYPSRSSALFPGPPTMRNSYLSL